MDSKGMDKSIVCGFFWPTLYRVSTIATNHILRRHSNRIPVDFHAVFSLLFML